VRSREITACDAELTDETGCPTLHRKDFRTGGTGGSACRAIFSRLLTGAIDAGKAKVEGLGRLVAAHLIPGPSAEVLSPLPKM